MKIAKVEIENFRVFYGKHNIDFSLDDDRSVTVLIGENGGGKTSFLNAIFWAFTGETTPRLENPSYLINKDAEREGSKTCAVEVTFIHNGEVSVLRRETQKGGAGKINFWSVNPKSGIRHAEDSVAGKNYVLGILPKELTPWFIFDGEAVGTIELTGSPLLKAAIHKTFGFVTLEEIKRDLESLHTEYKRELGSAVQNEQIVSLTNRIEATRKNIEGDRQRVQEALDRIQAAQRIYDEKSRRLIEADQSSDIERRRRIALDEKNRWQVQLNRETERLNEEVRANAHNAILGERLRNLSNALEDVSEAQDIPAPWNEILVKRILERSQCICGASLKEGTTERETVTSLLETASTQIMSKRMTRLAGLAFDKAKASESFATRISDFRKNIESFRVSVENQTTLLASIDREMANVKEELIDKLRQERSQAEDDLNHFRELKGALLVSISRDEQAVTRDEAEVDRLLNKLSQNQELKKQKERVSRLLDFVVGKLSSQETEVLRVLSLELSRAVERNLTKNFTVKIDPNNYSVTVFDSDGRETKLSTGERHTVTFAFVSAIIGMAASKTQFSKVQWIAQPVVAPLILDAPFSVTDSLYRANVAKTFTEQVEQCVLMFDGDKWRGELEDVLKPKIKRMYLLKSRAKGSVKSGIKSVVINGSTYPLNEYAAQREDSVIEEVNLDE